MIIILLLALGLRLINLNQSLWLDEAIEWWAVKTFDLRELLTGYMVGDFNPPGHHVLMWFWVRMFGDSEIALRMPSVIFGVGTVWFVYKIASLLRSDLGVRQGQTFRLTLAELAAGMAAVNGLLIYYSQEARMYAMAAFFVSGAMYWFLKMNKTNKTDKTNGTDYIIYCLLLAAALYSHYLTWLMLPFLAIWGFRYILPIVFTLPWWPLLIKQLQAGMAAAGNPVWASLSQTNVKNLALVAIKFVTGRVAWPESWWAQTGESILVISFWLLVCIGGIRVIREIREIGKIRENRKLMLVLWAFGPLMLGSLIGFIVPVFSYFRFLFAMPAVIILAARGVERFGRLGMLGMLGISGVFSLMYLFNSDFYREDWRAAAAQLHKQDTAPVVIIHPAVRPPFDYYDKNKSYVVPTADSRFTINDLSGTVWYIPYAQPIFDKDDLMRRSLENQGYVRTFERHFRGVTLEKWDKSDSLALW